jgi:steroid delta-isomerase-like uncharacterized protein
MIEAFNSSDWDTMSSLMGSAKYSELGTQRSLSGDDVIEAMKGWKAAMPDVTGTVTNTFESGDQVVQEVTWSGTHTGPLATPDGEIPASGNHQTTPASIVLEYDGDQLKEWRHYFDMLTFLQQIGAA